MTDRYDSSDEFAQRLLREAKEVEVDDARAFYNEDGDCLECLFSKESFKAERVDGFLTVYYGRDSKEIIGCFIKGVRKFIEETVAKCPGFKLDIEDGQLMLSLLFQAGMWQIPADGEEAKMAGVKYKKLRKEAETRNLHVDMRELCEAN